MTDNEDDWEPPEANEDSPPARNLRRRSSGESGGLEEGESARKKARSNTRAYTKLPNDLDALLLIKGKIDKKLTHQEYNETLSLRVLRMALTLQEDWLREKTRRGSEVERRKIKAPAIRPTVCRLLGISSRTYVRILSQYLAQEDVYHSVRSGNVKAKECRIPNTKAVQILIREFVRECRKELKRVTAKQVLDFLVEKEMVDIDRDETGIFAKKSHDTALRTTRRWLERNGYRRGRRKGNIRPKPEIAIKRDLYLQAFFANRSLPKETRLREVYLDESYIHEHYHRFDDSLWDPSDDQDIQIGKLQHKGRRYCFLAAIQGPDPRIDEPSMIRKEKAGLVRGSLWYFSPTKKKHSTGDYHKVFNSTNFIKWWREQLLPNLIQPSLIMMDNAKYHATYPLDIPKVSKLRKAETQAFLERKGVVYERTDTVAILHKRARQYIEAFEMRECAKLAQEQGHTVLMTPPYHSDFQPIEYLWARVKGEVGRQYDNKSTLALVLERLLAAFERVRLEGSDSVRGMIEKSAKTANEFYQRGQSETVAVDGTVSESEDEEDAPDGGEPEEEEEDEDDQRQGASDAEGSYMETQEV